MTHYQV